MNPYGFCQGVKHSIEILKQAGMENSSVFPLLPLMHNEKEMQKLSKEYQLSKDAKQAQAILFPAHGHTKMEEECFFGKKTYDAICPVLRKRHEFLKNHNDLKWFFYGKMEHQECKSFLSEFPFLNSVDACKDDFPELKEYESRALLVQSTIAEEKAVLIKKYFEEHSRLICFIGPCPAYLARKKEAVAFLKDRAASRFAILVLGSKTSSNCQALKNYFASEYRDAYVESVNSFEEISKEALEKQDFLLVSSTSISEESVLDIKAKLDRFTSSL